MAMLTATQLMYEREHMRAMRYGYARHVGEHEEPTNAVCDELRIDPATMTYRSRAQDKEIANLKAELETRAKVRKKDLKDIIAHFYKQSHPTPQ